VQRRYFILEHVEVLPACPALVGLGHAQSLWPLLCSATPTTALPLYAIAPPEAVVWVRGDV
jgi:hypothetical protein